MSETTTFYSGPRETVARFLEPGDQVAVIVCDKAVIVFPRTAKFVAENQVAEFGALRWATVTDKPAPVAALITGQQHGGAHDVRLEIPDVGPRTFQPGDREQLVYRVAIEVDPWQSPAIEGEVWTTIDDAVRAAAEHADDVYADTGSLPAATAAYDRKMSTALVPARPVSPADWQERADQLAYATLPRGIADVLTGRTGPFQVILGASLQHEPNVKVPLDVAGSDLYALQRMLPVGWCTREDCGAPSPLHLHQRTDR